MAHYRKVDARIWNDAKFRSLSKDGKLVFLFLLTNPNMTMLGAMRGTVIGLAAELYSHDHQGFLEGFRQALTQPYLDGFVEASEKGMVKLDERACLIWLPNFLKYNKPESPNVVKAWASVFDLLPECPLKHEVLREMKGTVEGLTEGFRKAFQEAFAKVFAKGMPNQEQEQEQEVIQPLPNGSGSRQRAERALGTSPEDPVFLNFPLVNGKDFPITKGQVAELQEIYQRVDVEVQLRNMRGWLLSNKNRRKRPNGILRFVHTWLKKEQDEHPVQVKKNGGRCELHPDSGRTPTGGCFACANGIPAEIQ